MFQSTDIVKKIFYINLFAFIFTIIGQNILGFPIVDYLALYPISDTHFQIFQPITHLFMHGSLSHIFFNMFALLSFGPWVENQIGSRKFLLFYFIMGFGAAILQMLLSNGAMIGASGAIFGVFVYFTILNPDAQLSIFLLPISFKAKHFLYFILGLEILSALFMDDGVGHFAHLGGALTGFILYKLEEHFNFNI
jgi:rhomboid-like protein